MENELNQLFDDEHNTPHKERRIILRQYCKTNGTLLIDSSSPFLNLCEDKECHNCRRYEDAFREVIKSWNIISNNNSDYIEKNGHTE